MTVSIALVNVDSGIDTGGLIRAAAAVQRQVIEHFFPAWGLIATCRVATAAARARADEWIVEIRSMPSIESALGYHTVTDTGLPLLYVFDELDDEDDVAWTVTLSHEILETLADPLLRRGTQDNQGRWWALEVCDAVEADTYEIDGIEVSNFITQQWGEPPLVGQGRFDHLGLCVEPWEIRPGGYGQVFDGGRWTQVGFQRRARAARFGLQLSRSFQRSK